MEGYKVKDKLKISSVLILFFVFTVFFYGPVGIYLSNADELSFGLGIVLKETIIVSLVIYAVLFGISLIVPGKIYKWYMLLVLGVGLGFYVQGNYINYNYGVLDGTEIQWSCYTKYGVLNTAIWLICILIPFIVNFFVTKKDKELINKVVLGICLFLIVIQIPAFISQLVSYKKKDGEALVITNDKMFEMGSEENIILFVLDTVDEEYYQTYLKKHKKFEEKNPGFVHYDNALTGGARTMIGMPIMFTGKPYSRQSTYTSYVDDAYGDDNVLSRMAKAGYDVRVYSEPLLYSNSTADYVSNFEVVSTPVTSESILTTKLYKLSLFKFVPHFLKSRFWMQTSEFDEAMKRTNSYSFNDEKFYKKYKEEKISVSSSVKKTFTVYHMRGLHRPFELNQNAVNIGESTRKKQMVGVMKIVGEYLEDLKENGLYDSSTIMITADHGDKRQCERIMLMIKEAGATGDVKYSHVPVSSFDFPVFFMNHIGETLPDQEFGTDIYSLEEDDIRERYLYRNASDNSKLVVRKYVTDSDADDHEALTLVEEFKDTGGDIPYVLGRRLGFDAEDNGNSYATDGFGNNHGFRTKMRGPYGCLDIPFESVPEKTITGHLELYSQCDMGYDAVIKAGGKEVYSHKIDEETVKKGIDFDVDPSMFENGRLKIEFEFPDIPQEEMESDVLKRTTTLSVVSLTFEEK